MILNTRVSPVKSSVLNNVKVINVYCVLHGVRGMGIKEIFIKEALSFCEGAYRQ